MKNTSRRGTWLALTAGLVALGGLGAGVLTLGSAPEPSAGKATTADRSPAKKMAFDVTTTANGELEAREKIEVRNPLDQSSTIVRIIAEGTWAKKGDLLIQLNADEIKQKVDEESLRLESARAELVAAENSYNIQVNENASKLREAELKVTLAELSLRQWQEGDVTKKRQTLDLAIDKAALELERLAQKYVRSQGLKDEGFISKDECDRDEVAYIEAISAFTTAHLEREVYENYEYKKDQKSKLSDLDEAQSQLERVRLNNEIELASKESKRSTQRRSVEIMQDRFKKLQKDFNATTILAPSDGLVVYGSSVDGARMWGGGEGPFQIGRQVYPNQLLMILPDTSEMVAVVRVNESLAGKVRPGQAVNVKVDAVGGRVFPGTVDSIGVMAEAGGWRDPNLREYTVRVALEGAKDAGLKPSMRCEGRLILDSVDEALVVPVQAVFAEGAVQFVYEPSGGRFVRTPVRVGRRSDMYAELKNGLDEGRTVLVREPAPAEVIAAAWNNDTLTTLGYVIGENGQASLPPSEGDASAAPGSGATSPGGATRPPRGNRGGNSGGGGNRPSGGGGGRPR